MNQMVVFFPLLVVLGAFMFFASRRQKRAMQATIDLHESLRVGDRVVALAVESITGVREFDRAMLSEVPPLLLQAHPEVLTAIGLLDGELMLVLDGSRIIREDELARLENSS